MVIRNSLIPFKGFRAMNLFGIIFVRKDCEFPDYSLNHEKIHTAQIIECGFIFFYIIYLMEFLINLITYRDFLRAYYSISFEKEAYFYQHDMTYLSKRKHYNWL